MTKWYERIIDEFVNDSDKNHRNHELVIIIHLINTDLDLLDDQREYLIHYLFNRLEVISQMEVIK